MHAISSYHGNRATNTATNPQTDRTDYNTLRRNEKIETRKSNEKIKENDDGLATW